MRSRETNHQRVVAILAIFVFCLSQITDAHQQQEMGEDNPLWYGESLTRLTRNADSLSSVEFARAEPDLTPISLAPVNSHSKRRQFIPGPVVPLAAPAVPVPAAGVCPGGPSLPVECDPKRPWPQCPPQSYCYATNSVDIGPYFCCPVWSTYGAAWRPATPFYNYVPPPPPNWNLRSAIGNWPAAAVGLPPFHRSRRPARLGVNNDGPPPEQLRHMIGVMNDWIQRENGHDKEPELISSGAEPSP